MIWLAACTTVEEAAPPDPAVEFTLAGCVEHWTSSPADDEGWTTVGSYLYGTEDRLQAWDIRFADEDGDHWESGLSHWDELGCPDRTITEGAYPWSQYAIVDDVTCDDHQNALTWENAWTWEDSAGPGAATNRYRYENGYLDDRLASKHLVVIAEDGDESPGYTAYYEYDGDGNVRSEETWYDGERSNTDAYIWRDGLLKVHEVSSPSVNYIETFAHDELRRVERREYGHGSDGVADSFSSFTLYFYADDTPRRVGSETTYLDGDDPDSHVEARWTCPP
ncbi:hypothetical protein LBMAG42_08030 [Deltaproteobacteria bacterium]|nr:hypothetical protein LBMAG42_08030 [Deltaproteobacteria bacterium]